MSSITETLILHAVLPFAVANSTLQQCCWCYTIAYLTVARGPMARWEKHTGNTELRSSAPGQQVGAKNSQRQHKVSMGQLWAAWQAAVTAHQLPHHQQLTFERRKKENKPPTTDPPPRPALTKLCLIRAAASLFLSYSCPFSPLPASRWMLYPHLSVISCDCGMKGTKQKAPDLIRKEGEFLDIGVCVWHIKGRNRRIFFFL